MPWRGIGGLAATNGYGVRRWTLPSRWMRASFKISAACSLNSKTCEPRAFGNEEAWQEAGRSAIGELKVTSEVLAQGERRRSEPVRSRRANGRAGDFSGDFCRSA